MSVLTPQELVLFNIAKKSLPRILFSDPTDQQEVFAAYAKELSASQTQVKFWRNMAFILLATDIWLDQHAKDRGTSRQAGETDEALRARIRDFLQTVTLTELREAITNILEAYGVTIPAGYPGLVELRGSRAYFNFLPGYVQCSAGIDIVDGETVTIFDGITTKVFEFNKAGGVTGLDIAVAVSDNDTKTQVSTALQAAIAGAGLNVNTSFSANAVGRILIYNTVSGNHVSVSDAVANSNFSTQSTGNAAFFSRGYRMGDERNEIIIILPYGTPAAVTAIVLETLRQKKAAGVGVLVEIRGVP